MAISKMITIVLASFIVSLGIGYHAAVAADSTLTPIEKIPKLSESYELVDYKDVFAGGTLLPDRIRLDTSWIKTGSSERSITNLISDSLLNCDGPRYRTREEQWAVIRGLLYQNNYSMHYYKLADLYYHKQMSGWFKTCEFPVQGVGTIRVYLHGNEEAGDYRVWLIQLTLEETSPGNISYVQGEELTLIRPGPPEIVWNIAKNRVFIRTNN